MTKNGKIATGVVVAAVIVVGGFYIYGKKQVDTIEQHINEAVAQLQPMLPKGTIQNNVFNKGTFESNGIYTLDIDDGKEKQKVVVNYNIQHGVDSYFTGRYKVHSTTNLEGTIKQVLKFNGPVMTTEGVVTRSGNMDLDNKIPEITLEVNDEESKGSVVIAPSTQTVKYDHSSGDIKTLAKLPLMTINEENPYSGKTKVDIKDMTVKRDFNKKQTSLGDFNINIKAVDSEQAQLENIDVNSKVELKDSKYNLHADAKIDKITIPMLNEKDASLEVSYSLNGLDSGVANYYAGLYEKYQNKEELKPEDKAKSIEQMKVLLAKGVTLSLDKFAAKGSFGSFDIDGKFLTNSGSPDTFTLDKNSELSLNIKGDGKVADLLAMGIYTNGGIPVENKKTESLDFKAHYKEGKLVVDGKEVEHHPIPMMIQNSLKETDYKLGFTKEFQPVRPSGFGVPSNGIIEEDDEIELVEPPAYQNPQTNQ